MVQWVRAGEILRQKRGFPSGAAADVSSSELARAKVALAESEKFQPLKEAHGPERGRSFQVDSQLRLESQRTKSRKSGRPKERVSFSREGLHRSDGGREACRALKRDGRAGLFQCVTGAMGRNGRGRGRRGRGSRRGARLGRRVATEKKGRERAGTLGGPVAQIVEAERRAAIQTAAICHRENAWRWPKLLLGSSLLRPGRPRAGAMSRGASPRLLNPRIR